MGVTGDAPAHTAANSELPQQPATKLVEGRRRAAQRQERKPVNAGQQETPYRTPWMQCAMKARTIGKWNAWGLTHGSVSKLFNYLMDTGDRASVALSKERLWGDEIMYYHKQP
jgi:hypothetical protein